MSKTTDIIAKLAEPIVKECGCELWDIEFLREAGIYYLRVFVDKEGGVSILDCENISRKLDPILDEADPISESYTFEVSSAGAERALKRPSDFERFLGSYVAVKLYSPKNGLKEYIGYLRGYEGGAVTVEVNGENTRFEKNEVAGVRLRIK